MLISAFHVAFHQVPRRIVNTIAVLRQTIEAIQDFLGPIKCRILVVRCDRGYDLLALTVTHLPSLTVRKLSYANACHLIRL